MCWAWESAYLSAMWALWGEWPVFQTFQCRTSQIANNWYLSQTSQPYISFKTLMKSWGFWDWIEANAFPLFLSVLFTCWHLKPAQMWLVNRTETTGQKPESFHKCFPLQTDLAYFYKDIKICLFYSHKTKPAVHVDNQHENSLKNFCVNWTRNVKPLTWSF